MSKVDELRKEIESLRTQNRALARAAADSNRALEALANHEVDAVLTGERSATPLLLRTAQDALRRSELLMRAIFDRSLDAMLLADDAGTYVDANPAACELFGLSRAELLGRNVEDFAPLENEAAKVFHAFRSDGRTRGQFPLRRHDGSVRLLEYSAAANVAPHLHLSILRDVTEKAAMERERDGFFTMTLDLLCIAGMDGRFRRVNPSWTRTLGWSSEDLVSRPWLDFVHPDDRADTERERARLTEGKATIGFANRYRCKDGSYRWLEWLCTPSPGDGLIFASAHELTEQRIAAQRDRLLFMESPLAMWVLDGRTLRILDVNTAATTIYGYAREEFIGMPLEMVVAPEQRDDLRIKWREAMSAGAANSMSRIHLTKSGRRVLVQVSAKRLGFGAESAIFSSMLDVTVQRQLEAQLAQAQKMEAIGNLAGGVAHDFNNLLSVILSYTNLLLDDLGVGDAKRSDLEEIHKAGLRATELTRHLLTFSRQQVLEPAVLDLNTILRGMDALLRRLVREDVALTFLLAPDLGPAFADAGQLEQVVMNLVVNAVDAMPTGGALKIHTANVQLDEDYAARHHGVSPGAFVMLSVTDTGTGMDAATQAHMFEPFFTTKQRGKGTGLGLATVFGIVKQSGGHIWADSEPGHGTTFKLYFPRTDQPLSAPDPTPQRPTLTLQGQETILLAEDDASVRAIVLTILRRNGYTVLEARNGAEALATCERFAGTIHLLLTDVVMPQMSGRELAEQLSNRRPRLKLLYMSGYTDDAIVHHGVLESGVAFLQKPLTPDTLLRKVRAVLDAAPEAPLSRWSRVR